MSLNKRASKGVYSINNKVSATPTLSQFNWCNVIFVVPHATLSIGVSGMSRAA
ncbi:hypothetical protein VAEU17_220065 [Vibrio aestuarianus]|nr:hypothetical protein VAEU17_220065 [Vibrio aestuarianus]